MAFQHSAHNTSHFNDILISSKALSSIISLPADPSIHYTIFTPALGHGSSDSVSETIELARRGTLSRNEASASALLESLLPSVHISKEDSFMYVFAVTSGDKCGNGLDTLRGLQFDGLIGEPCFNNFGGLIVSIAEDFLCLNTFRDFDLRRTRNLNRILSEACHFQWLGHIIDGCAIGAQA